MARERVIRAFAGTLVLVGSILAVATHNLWWLILPGIVGFNLLQSSITRFCALEMILAKAGVEGCDGKRTGETSVSAG